MDKAAYLARKPQAPAYREECLRCRRPRVTCLCAELEPFDPGFELFILMHTEEAKYQRTGTGRLAHLMLAGSRLLVGRDFTGDPEVERLASDPAAFPCVLFPAPDALDLSRGGLGAAALGGRALRVFVADGTWRQAGALLRRSAPLAALPRVTFAPPFRSGFAFKRQPKPEALSTIEALYCLLSELERLGLARPEGRQQDLLRVFRRMVDRQLVHVPPQGRGAPR